jgi:hypothetical protein
VHPFMSTKQQHNIIQHFIHTQHKGKLEKPYLLFISYIIQYIGSMAIHKIYNLLGFQAERPWKPQPLLSLTVSRDLPLVGSTSSLQALRCCVLFLQKLFSSVSPVNPHALSSFNFRFILSSMTLHLHVTFQLPHTTMHSLQHICSCFYNGSSPSHTLVLCSNMSIKETCPHSHPVAVPHLLHCHNSTTLL